MSKLTDIERARRDAMRTAAYMKHMEAFCEARRKRREAEQASRKARRVKPGPNHNLKMAGNTYTIHRAGPLGH